MGRSAGGAEPATCSYGTRTRWCQGRSQYSREDEHPWHAPAPEVLRRPLLACGCIEFDSDLVEVIDDSMSLTLACHRRDVCHTAGLLKAGHLKPIDDFVPGVNHPVPKGM